MVLRSYDVHATLHERNHPPKKEVLLKQYSLTPLSLIYFQSSFGKLDEKET